MRNNAKKREKKESAETKRHTFKKRNDVLKRHKNQKKEFLREHNKNDDRRLEMTIYCMLYFSLLL